MKKVIVTAATAFEIEIFVHYLKAHFVELSPNVFQNDFFEIHIVISGVGMMSTAFCLGRKMSAEKFDVALQAGIAGAFDQKINLADLVAVSSECYGDLGAEDHEEFIDIFELGFENANQAPFNTGRLKNQSPYFMGATLPLVHSLSVNTVSGAQGSIDMRLKKFNCQIESMEGIAFHYACIKSGIPFLQIRAISNYVTPRDKSKWQIKKAIEHVNQYLIETFSK